MGLKAHSVISTVVNSSQAGGLAARELKSHLDKVSVVLVYATVNHDQGALLRGIQSVLGADVPLLGCSSQGVMANRFVSEDGFLLGIIGLGGPDLSVSTALVEDIDQDTARKGAQLGRALRDGLGAPPKAVVLHYDSICGASIDLLVDGLSREISAPVIGGGAGQPFTRLVQTFQYFSNRVVSHGAVAMALAGDFLVDSAICHGTTPVGIEMTVTKSDGNHLLELDNRSALEIWRELAGGIPPYNEYTSALALGLPFIDEAGESRYQIYAALQQDVERGGLVMPGVLRTGTRVMLHHRTIESVLDGTADMAGLLRRRLDPNQVRAVLGFECAARAEPFLGRERVLTENIALQETIAPNAAWLGMLAHGEVYPVSRTPAVHNYSYPLLVLADVAGHG